MLLILSEEVIDKLVERLVVRIEEGNEYILKKMGSTIKDIGTLTPTQVHQLSQIMQYGGDYDKIVKKIAEITNTNVKDIYEIFDEVVRNNYTAMSPLYDYRNIRQIPYEENIVLKNQVRALATITADRYTNIMNTLAFARHGKNGRVYYTNIGKMYQEIVDEGILNISQGKESFDTVMSRIVKELGNSGIRTVDYESGRSMRVDSAVRMHMKDALTNLHNETQKIFGEQFKSDGVEISVHLTPAPDHALVQGRQFSNKEFEKFQTDQDATSYDGILFPAISDETGRDRRSIGQYNCYHIIFPVILGISKPEYTNEELQQMIDESNKIINIDGHDYTKYECTQLQRQIETAIRSEKEKYIIAKASNTDEAKDIMAKSQEKISQLTDKYKDISEKAELPTYMDRMRVSGYTGKIRKKQVVEIEENTDYMMDHRPTQGSRVWDISEAVDTDEYGVGSGTFMPSDVYQHPEWYFNLNDTGVKESINAIQQLKGVSPDAEITIYRAAPKGVLNNGDWVTLSKEYAEYHNYSNLDNKGKVYAYKVKASDVAFAGDDIREFGYFGKKKIYKKK